MANLTIEQLKQRIDEIMAATESNGKPCTYTHQGLWFSLEAFSHLHPHTHIAIREHISKALLTGHSDYNLTQKAYKGREEAIRFVGELAEQTWRILYKQDETLATLGHAILYLKEWYNIDCGGPSWPSTMDPDNGNTAITGV